MSALSPETDAKSREELAERALAFYKNTLKDKLEPEYDGKGIAVHPDSGEYVIAATPTHASREMWKRHPEGRFISLRIGPTPDYALSARILAGRMQAQAEAKPASPQEAAS